MIAHVDPFYAECRAYGCIEAKGRNGKVAVRCHGFTSIPVSREEELAEKFGIVGWERPGEEEEQADSTGAPLRAIVKELVSDEVPFTGKMIRRMKADLSALRRMCIYTRDIRADNYKGGKLVDFSTSWTKPHIMLSERYWSRKTIDRDKDWELTEFDDMIEESGIPTWIRATPNPNYISRLRARKPTQRSPSDSSTPETQRSRTNLHSPLSDRYHPVSSSEETDSYEIDKIIDKRIVRADHGTKYLVRWKGYSPENDQWMDESELQNAQELVRAYESTIASTTKKRKQLLPQSISTLDLLLLLHQINVRLLQIEEKGDGPGRQKSVDK